VSGWLREWNCGRASGMTLQVAEEEAGVSARASDTRTQRLNTQHANRNYAGRNG
jgi:hypothetical protein